MPARRRRCPRVRPRSRCPCVSSANGGRSWRRRWASSSRRTAATCHAWSRCSRWPPAASGGSWPAPATSADRKLRVPSDAGHGDTSGMRTQVGIIGAGPAGLLLSRLLTLQGIDSVVLENRSREYVEGRIRAGILEQHSVDTLIAAGVGDRLQREGLEHHGIYLQYPGTRHQLDFQKLCGRSVWAYGQTEVVKDLITAQLDGGPPLLFGVSDVVPEDVDTENPRIRFTDADGAPQVLECDAIAGTDGFHGVSRPVVTASARGQLWERTYPYAWLGILADAAPATDELIYSWHPDGFALYSMRSPTVSRLYLQVDPSEKIENWSDERIWDALDIRFTHEGW